MLVNLGAVSPRAERGESHELEKTVGGLLILAGFLSIDIYPAYDCEDAFVASSKRYVHPIELLRR